MCILKWIFCKHDYRIYKDNGHYFVLKCTKCKKTINKTLNKPL